jgi:lipooligosaccharide transport system permease protein
MPAGILTGLAFAVPVMTLSAVLPNGSANSVLLRIGITPLFLLGGAFFPINRLPQPLQVLVWVTPISHGVELSRGLALERIDPQTAFVHVTSLLAYIVAGFGLARVTFRRQLVQ